MVVDHSPSTLSTSESISDLVDIGYGAVALCRRAMALSSLSDEDDDDNNGAFTTPFLAELQLLRRKLRTCSINLMQSLRMYIGCLSVAEHHVEQLRATCEIGAKNLEIQLQRIINDGSFSPNPGGRSLEDFGDDRMSSWLSTVRDEIRHVVVPYLQILYPGDELQRIMARSVITGSIPVEEHHEHIAEAFERREEADIVDSQAVKKPTQSIVDSAVFSADEQPQRSFSTAIGERSRAKIELVQEFILEGLSYSSMKEREREVSEAHQRTFEWVLVDKVSSDGVSVGNETQPSTFQSWLSGDELGGLYWINGKAGSGKSTLLAYICHHAETKQKLQRWAGGESLIMASFYFWTSGSPEQRSQPGLLRSLLFQMLDQQRYLIEVVFPDLWNHLITATTKERIAFKLSWSLADLMLGLKLCLEHAASSTKICLLIDGLDEFNGNHKEIIELFCGVARNLKGRIKICLSSRPWPVFEEAFGNGPNLRLQDLTLNDMGQYVKDRFGRDPRVRRIIRKERDQGNQLMQDIVKRAHGVFLYTVLAVRFLLMSLQAEHKIADLEAGLNKLPSELDELFEYTLFDNHTTVSIELASKIMQLVRAREIVCGFTNGQSSAFLTLWDLGLAVFPPENGFDHDIVEVSHQEVKALCSETQSNLEASCAGLLAVYTKSSNHSSIKSLRFNIGSTSTTSLTSSKITFLHRTIRDWLTLPKTWNKILFSTASTSFCPHASLLASQILIYRLPLEAIERHRRLDEWWPDIVLALTHARYIPPEQHVHSTSLINLLDATLSSYWTPRNGDHWARNAFGSYEERNKSEISTPFLSLCVKFGLVDYVRDVLCPTSSSIASRHSATSDQAEYIYTAGPPLLSLALDFPVSRRQSICPDSSPELINLLLIHASTKDVNQTYHEIGSKKPTTPWSKLLSLLREAHRRKWLQSWDIPPRSSHKHDMHGREAEGKYTDHIERLVEITTLMIRGGADLNLYLAKTAWDEEISALGVFELVFQGCGDFRIASLVELMARMGASHWKV